MGPNDVLNAALHLQLQVLDPIISSLCQPLVLLPLTLPLYQLLPGYPHLLGTGRLHLGQLRCEVCTQRRHGTLHVLYPALSHQLLISCPLRCCLQLQLKLPLVGRCLLQLPAALGGCTLSMLTLPRCLLSRHNQHLLIC